MHDTWGRRMGRASLCYRPETLLRAAAACGDEVTLPRNQHFALPKTTATELISFGISGSLPKTTMISFEELKRIAQDLGESMTDEDLQEMLDLAERWGN